MGHAWSLVAGVGGLAYRQIPFLNFTGGGAGSSSFFRLFPGDRIAFL